MSDPVNRQIADRLEEAAHLLRDQGADRAEAFQSDARWLPILHSRRGGRRYTALYSNTARAHRAGRTRDWVVLYVDANGGEQQHTVITAGRGSLRGQRVVAGREAEGAAPAVTAA